MRSYVRTIAVAMLLISVLVPFQKVMRNFTIYPCDIVLPLIFIGWASRVILIDRPALKDVRGKKVLLFFLPFMLAGALSGLNAKDFFRYAGYIYLWGQIPISYLIAVNLIRKKEDIWTALYTIFAIATVSSLFYIINFLYVRYYNIGDLRAAVLLYGDIHKNIRAVYLGLTIPLLLGAVVFHLKTRLKILLCIALSLCLLGLVLTASRWGAYLGFLSLFFLGVFFVGTNTVSRRHIKNIAFIALILPCLFLIYVVIFDEYLLFRALSRLLKDSLSLRIGLYAFAFDVFKQHPIVGIGWGNFLIHARVFYDHTWAVHPHNMIVGLLAETGLLGIIGFSLLVRNLARHIHDVVRHHKTTYRYILWGATTSLLFFFVNNLLDFTLAHGIGIQVGITLAVIDSIDLNTLTRQE